VKSDPNSFSSVYHAVPGKRTFQKSSSHCLSVSQRVTLIYGNIHSLFGKLIADVCSSPLLHGLFSKQPSLTTAMINPAYEHIAFA
jgi:hypothetical protein